MPQGRERERDRTVASQQTSLSSVVFFGQSVGDLPPLTPRLHLDSLIHERIKHG